HDPALHAHSVRGRDDVRLRPHHQPRSRRRRRHAGGAAPAGPEFGRDVRQTGGTGVDVPRRTAGGSPLIVGPAAGRPPHPQARSSCGTPPACPTPHQPAGAGRSLNGTEIGTMFNLTPDQWITLGLLAAIALVALIVAISLFLGLFQARSLIRRELSAYFLSPI